MLGIVAVTDFGWYERLLEHQRIEEANFWKPSATRGLNAPPFSPFIFKLRSPYNAICGFGYFARYSRLPDWLAWETFGEANGCISLQEMRSRIESIRQRIRFRGGVTTQEIGCILIVQPVFFPRERWVAAPSDWPVRTQSDKRYDLARGEGARVWEDCLATAAILSRGSDKSGARRTSVFDRSSARFGTPTLTAPRLGQGTFRIAVIEAYGRACAVTEEHSLPALEASHIMSFADNGPHEISNGVLLRADLHRLFDKGYLTVDSDRRLVVSRRLRDDFNNGRTYYPLHGHALRLPARVEQQPAAEFLEFHRNNCFRG